MLCRTATVFAFQKVEHILALCTGCLVWFNSSNGFYPVGSSAQEELFQWFFVTWKHVVVGACTARMAHCHKIQPCLHVRSVTCQRTVLCKA